MKIPKILTFMILLNFYGLLIGYGSYRMIDQFNKAIG